MKIKLGNMRRGDYFVLDGDIYKIIGIGNRSYNNVQCKSEKKRIWLDLDTEVEELILIVEKNIR